MPIKSRIKEARKKRGLTQKQLAEKLGVSTAMIAQYETGKRNPKIQTLEKIASALDIPSYELINWGITLELLDNDLLDASADKDADKEIILIDQKYKSIMDNNDLSDLQKQKLLSNLISQTQILSIYHSMNASNASKNMMNSLMDKLNAEGQLKAVEQVELLTKISEYQKKNIEQEMYTPNKCEDSDN